MTPDDLLTVQRSWARLRVRRPRLVAALTCLFAAVDTSPIPPSIRAAWLFGAVDGLVGHLAAPSRLAAQARSIGASWPDPLTAPSFAVDGRAWLAAAADCLPDWSDRTGAAWKEAWFLLSDVLATEALSPFVARPHATRTSAPEHGPLDPFRPTHPRHPASPTLPTNDEQDSEP